MWIRVSKIFTCQVGPAPIASIFYQVVVKSVLLYGNESWGLPPSALKVVKDFNVETTRQMTVMRPQGRMVDPWVYLDSANVLTVAHLKPVVTYIRR